MKKSVMLVLSFLVLSLSLFAVIQSSLWPSLQAPHSVTGKVDSGIITLFIEGGVFTIAIDNPLNVTYNFNPGSNYTLGLNVSANSDVSLWWYSLYDLRHSTMVNSTVYFTPNTTINAVRWSNELTVYANTSSGEQASKSVIFSIEVPNTSPILGQIPHNILVCEGSSLLQVVTASDADEETLVFTISPQGPFFIFPSNNTLAHIISGILSKGNVGNHSEAVSVNDGTYVDTGYTNISVIEINNPPSISNVGVQTVWNNGENTTFFKQLVVSDLESGNLSLAPSNFTVNISFANEDLLFNITNTGVMNFSALGKNISVHNISVCVMDNGLRNIHPNISLCSQDGSNLTLCSNFSLTITNANRAPYFSSWSPVSLSLNATGEENLVFNILKRDPDGTVPDSYWYVDGEFKAYLSGSSADSFTYAFPCDVFSGEHSVSSVITDGLLNATLEWDIYLIGKACTISSSSGGGGSTGGGGGGSSIAICEERWACDAWSVCQNLEDSLKQKAVLSFNYLVFKQNCSTERFNGDSCGYQLRSCFDVNNCNSTYIKPEESRYCKYSKAPSCSDTIQNCHDNECELLADCGGPCAACSTCSDGIKNQGEQGIDCGVPCPTQCRKVPGIWQALGRYTYLLTYLILITLLILIILTLIRIIKAMRYRSEIEGLEWYTIFLKRRDKV